MIASDGNIVKVQPRARAPQPQRQPLSVPTGALRGALYMLAWRALRSVGGRRRLHAIADVCVVPLGAPGGASVGDEVRTVCRLLKEWGGGVLATRTHG